jgi:hypothetical protein
LESGLVPPRNSGRPRGWNQAEHAKDARVDAKRCKIRADDNLMSATVIEQEVEGVARDGPPPIARSQPSEWGPTLRRPTTRLV